MSDKYSNASHTGSVNQSMGPYHHGTVPPPATLPPGAVMQPGSSGTHHDHQYHQYTMPHQPYPPQNYPAENVFSHSYTYGKSQRKLLHVMKILRSIGFSPDRVRRTPNFATFFAICHQPMANMKNLRSG